MTSASIRSISGASTFMARPHQSTKVLSGMSAPMRAKISCWRYKGRWSSNLETRMWAKRPAPAMLPGIGRVGAATCTMRSQRRQDFLGRAIWTTFSCAAIRSSISLISSPTTRRSPPQSGQQLPGSSSCRSRGVLSETRGRRRDGRSAVSSAGSKLAASGTPSGTAVSLSTEAISRSSSASSSCSISRSIFSEDWPKTCFFSLAMRNRRVWINASWARNVAEIFAFSACKAATNAFRSAGSSGRVWAAFDMRPDTTRP